LLLRIAKRGHGLITSIHLPAIGVKLIVSIIYDMHMIFSVACISAVRFFYNEPLFRSKCERIGRRFRMEQLPHLTGSSSIEFGDNVRLSGKSAMAFSDQIVARPILKVGDGVFIGRDCGLHIAHSIKVGDNTLIAKGVSIYDFDGHPYDADERREEQIVSGTNRAPVKIGRDVWVGSRAIILRGVIVGNGAIIAAGSVWFAMSSAIRLSRATQPRSSRCRKRAVRLCSASAKVISPDHSGSSKLRGAAVARSEKAVLQMMLEGAPLVG